MRAIYWRYTLLLLTIDDWRQISLLPRTLSTLAKNSWQWIQFQQEHTNSRRWWQRPPPLAAESPAAPSPNPPQKPASSWRHSSAPHRQSMANSKRSRTYRSFKQRLTLQTGPVWTCKQESEGKGHLRPQQTLLLRRRQPLRRKMSPAHRKSEIWKELAHTQNAVRWFLFGSCVPWTASTLEEMLLTRNPSTRLTDTSFQTWFLCSRRAKTATGNVLNEPSCPWVVLPCLP